MTNPYTILGVDPNATDDVINKAYRSLARKYHPDVNQNSKEAEEKMKEINKAYDDIKRMRNGGNVNSNNQYYYNNSSNNYNYNNYYSNDNVYQNVIMFIRIGLYSQAWQVLNSISNKDDRWFYYGAVILFETSNKEAVLSYISKALELNPNNSEYLQYQDYIIHNEKRNVTIIKVPFIFKLIGWFIIIRMIMSFISFIFGG